MTSQCSDHDFSARSLSQTDSQRQSVATERAEGGSQRWTKATQLSNGGPAIGIQITFSLLLVNACVLWQRNYANTSLGNDTPYLGLFRDTMGNFVSPNDTFFFALKKKKRKSTSLLFFLCRVVVAVVFKSYDRI